MIESRLQTGHQRKMILSQSFAQSVASLVGATETGIKRIVLHRGSASGSDPPRSSPEAEPRLLKKSQLKENIPSYLQAVGQESNYWPVIRLLATTEIRQWQPVCICRAPWSTIIERLAALSKELDEDQTFLRRWKRHV